MKIKGNKGITLISLVITIIVLLILAGISIAMLTGESGILTQADKATEATRGGDVDETLRMWEYSTELEKYTDRNDEISLSEQLDELVAKGKLTPEERVELEANKKVEIGGILVRLPNVEENDGNDKIYLGDLPEGTKVMYNNIEWAILYDGENGDPFTNKVELVSTDALDEINLDSNTYTTEELKNNYRKAIEILNGSVQQYNLGDALSVRHVGTDPTNPNAYAMIGEQYVDYYDIPDDMVFERDTNENGYIYRYGELNSANFVGLEQIVQNHHETDINKLKTIDVDGENMYDIDGQSYFLGSRTATVQYGKMVYSSGQEEVSTDLRYFCLRYKYENDEELRNVTIATYGKASASVSGRPGTPMLRPVIAFSPDKEVELDTVNADTYIFK